MPVESRSLKVEPTRDRIRCLFIVARDQPNVWRFLKQDFAGDARVQVILDRRRGERRKHGQTHEPDRRQADRRRAAIDTDLRYRSFVIIHEQEGRLSA